MVLVRHPVWLTIRVKTYCMSQEILCPFFAWINVIRSGAPTQPRSALISVFFFCRLACLGKHSLCNCKNIWSVTGIFICICCFFYLYLFNFICAWHKEFLRGEGGKNKWNGEGKKTNATLNDLFCCLFANFPLMSCLTPGISLPCRLHLRQKTFECMTWP